MVHGGVTTSISLENIEFDLHPECISIGFRIGFRRCSSGLGSLELVLLGNDVNIMGNCIFRFLHLHLHPGCI